MMDIVQGPGPPWCVGSVFSSPQLLTRSSLIPVGSLLFDCVGNPHHVMSTGYVSQLSSTHIIDPLRQVSYLSESPSNDYFPQPIINELLQEDVTLKFLLSVDNNQYFGNRLQGRKCRDGKMQLFFPVHQNGERVASALCHRDNNQKLCYTKKCCQKDYDQHCEYSQMNICCSSSLSHPIVQLSVAENNVLEGDSDALLAARTAYQFHVFNVKTEEGHASFTSDVVKSFQQPTSHVTWNPHVEAEVALMLQTGEIQLFDIQSCGKICGIFKAGSILRNHTSSQNQFDSISGEWCRCEYAWHPKTLIVAGTQEITMLDLRIKDDNTETQNTFQGNLANLKDMNCRSNFCYQTQLEKDNFVALARASYDGMYQFAAASKKHLFLFDARQPGCPLIQWEHAMKHDPPGLLLMCPLSNLCPSVQPESCEISSAGRVILAASFRSGDLRVFCYGPRPPPDTHEASVNISKKRSKLFASSFQDELCAWELPSKMIAAKANPDSWKEQLRSSAGLFGRRDAKSGATSLLEGNQIIENIAGLIIVPSVCSESNKITKGFEMLQLTGMGDILAQSYKASNSLSNGSSVFKNSKSSSFVFSEERSSLRQRCVSIKLFSLFNYIYTGHVPLSYRTKEGSPVLGLKHQSYQDNFNDEIVGGQQSRAGKRKRPDEQHDLGCQENESQEDTSQKIRIPGLRISFVDKDEVLATTSPLKCNEVINQAFIQEVLKLINSPLNIYEVAMKALWMTVPSALVDSDVWYSLEESKLVEDTPKVSDVLEQEVSVQVLEKQTHHCRLPITSRQKDEPPIPLPFLLAVNHHIKKNFLQRESGNPAEVRTQSTDMNSYDCLIDSCNQVQKALSHFKPLEAENLHDVVSLDDPYQPWKTCVDDSSRHEFDALIFQFPNRPELQSGASRVNSHPGSDSNGIGLNANKRPCQPDHEYKNSMSPPGSGVNFNAGRDRFCNFFGGGTFDDPAVTSKTDLSFCPFNMPFTNSGEELQPEEVDAIMSLKSDFKDWQQSFTPYKIYCNSNICKWPRMLNQ